MKAASISLLFAAVLLGGASAGVTTYLLLGRGSSAARETTLPVPGTPGRGPEAELLALSERVAALEEENRDLQMLLATLEDRPVHRERAPVEGFATRSELEALREELRATRAGQSVPLPEPAQLKEQVADVLVDLRKEEAVSKVRALQEKRTARLDEDVQRISDWLGLNGYQRDELRGILVQQYEREDEVRRLWEEGAEDELLGERKQSDLALFRSDLERVLTPDQLDTFWARITGGGKGQ